MAPTAREVFLTRDAEIDLSDILSYIAERNPIAAGGMGAKFDGLFTRIALAPYAGWRSSRSHETRRRMLGNYAVYYELDEANDRVVILAIIHGARVHHRMRRH